MVRMWEDEILSDPDSVDVTALFDDIRCEDDRKQYEAVAGLYFLADLRPSRLEPFEDEVVGLLGELSDFSLGASESSGGTRGWGTEAVGQYTRAYPHVVPELFHRVENSDTRTREDACRALGYAVGFLEISSDVGLLHGAPDVSSDEYDARSSLAERVHGHHATIADWLHDGCRSTTSTALRLLAGIAPWYCAESSEAIPVAVSHLNDGTNSRIQSSAIGLLRSVALCNERRRGEMVEQLVGELREPHPETPKLLFITLMALVEIAEQHPESRSQMEDWHRGLTDHEDHGVRTVATKLRSLLETP